MNPKIALANFKLKNKWRSQKAKMALLKKESKFIDFTKVSAARVQFAREFYTKVFAYKLAHEVRNMQRIRVEQGRPIFRETVQEARKLLMKLSPVVEGYSKKSIDGNFNIIQGNIRIFSPKGFDYHKVTFKEAQKFINDAKGIISQERIAKIKPKMLTYLDKPIVSKKPVSSTKNMDFSYLKKNISSSMDELHSEAKRLKDIISIHRAGSEEAEAKEFEIELERVEEMIRKRNIEKNKNSSLI